MGTIDELLAKYEHQAQTYWDFMSQEEREEYAWLAGIIDGEGSIQISYTQGHRRGQKYFRLILAVNMTHEACVGKCLRITCAGSIIRCYTPKMQAAGHRPTFRWQVADKNAASILRRCLPFLEAKKQQAILAIQFQELKASESAQETHNLTPSMWERRKAIKNAIHQLNRGNTLG